MRSQIYGPLLVIGYITPGAQNKTLILGTAYICKSSPTQVGNAIGRGAATEAKRAMQVSAILSIPFAAAVSMVAGLCTVLRVVAF